MKNIAGLARQARAKLAGVRSLQGLGGTAIVCFGVYRLAGLGWCAVAAGAFLLLGAWMSR